MGTKANQSTTYTKSEVDNNLILKANQSTTSTKAQVDNNLALKADKATTYTKAEVDNNLTLKADKATTYTKTEVGNSLDTQQKNIFLEIPPTNASRLFDHGDNKSRAINVTSPLSIQTTNAAYLTIQADCFTKAEVNSSLA